MKKIDADAWPMIAWLDVLHAALQPRGVLIIGAGWGNSEWIQWLRTRDVVSADVHVNALEADEQKCRCLQESARDNGWMIRQGVVAPAPGEATFYHASSPGESGLLPVKVQQMLWPNLRAEGTTLIYDAMTLDMALDEAKAATNWLILDCLPAAALLQGGKQLLEQLDVALVRVASGLPDDTLADSQSVSEALGRAGMRLIHLQEERHPALAHALYVRDSAGRVQELRSAYEQATTTAKSLSRQLRIKRETAEQAQHQADVLQKEIKSVREEAEKAQRRARQLQNRLKSTEQEILKLEKKAKPAVTRPSGGDADIDEFLNDISPFFAGRSITYVDIGAFIGEIPLKIVGHGKIRLREAHLFEPNPESFEQLVENTKSLKLPKMHLYNYALGADEALLTFSASKSMTKVVNYSGNPAGQPGFFQAESKRLDSLQDLFTDHHIDLLKIDVEGFETEVIDGAQILLREQRVDVIYIEVGFNRLGSQQSYFGEVDIRLQELGYRVFKIYEQRHEWIADSPLLRRCNFAYMSSRFAEANPYKVRKQILELRNEINEMRQDTKLVGDEGQPK